MPVPILKDILNEGRVAVGSWQFIGHPDVTTVIGEAGFDYVLLDTEHTGMSIETVRECIVAANEANMATVVRVSEGTYPHFIQQVLEAGAQGINLTMIETAAQVEKLVRAVRFPPLGERGYCPAVRAARFGRRADYMESSNRDCLVVISVETPEGVGNLGEILEVEGLDVVKIGRADLSARLGLETNGPEIHSIIDDLNKQIVAAGKVVGVWKDYSRVTAPFTPPPGPLLACCAVDIGMLLNQMSVARDLWRGPAA